MTRIDHKPHVPCVAISIRPHKRDTIELSVTNHTRHSITLRSWLWEQWHDNNRDTRVRKESRPVLLPLISFHFNFIRNFYSFQENNIWHLFSGFTYKPLQYVYFSLDQSKILLSSYDVTKGWRKTRNSLRKSCHTNNINNNIFLDQDLF